MYHSTVNCHCSPLSPLKLQLRPLLNKRPYTPQSAEVARYGYTPTAVGVTSRGDGNEVYFMGIVEFLTQIEDRNNQKGKKMKKKGQVGACARACISVSTGDCHCSPLKFGCVARY